jgi:sialate O-acetylesterase
MPDATCNRNGAGSVDAGGHMTPFQLRGFCLLTGFSLLACILALPARADVRLAGVYGDHMVLQQGQPLSIRGFADAGEKVTVKLAGQSISTVTDVSGQWRVAIAPLKASSSPVEFTVTGKNTLALQNVLVGDVWLCSGQSNMVYPLGKDQSAAEELPKANHPAMRLCQVSNRALREPLSERSLKWAVCTPAEAGHFSGVSYFFGREIHQATGVPIGLICSAVAGTPAQCWTSLEALKSDPAFKPYTDLYQTNLAKAGPTNAPAEAVPGTPSSLFNGMIAPLTALSIKGVAWYQGESNAGEAELYRKLFPALIADWRKQWNQPHLPFLFVQLPPFGRRQSEPGASQWASLREAQARTLSVPDTGMAVVIDLGRPRNILHPPNKREVGRRLGLVARAMVYKQNIDYCGPAYQTSKIEGNRIRVRFHNAESGLSVGTPCPMDPTQVAAAPGLALKGFCIAGADHKFVRAEAVVDGNTVLVSSEKVAAPVFVQYGWEDNPEVNLYDKKGFPVAPFRTW